MGYARPWLNWFLDRCISLDRGSDCYAPRFMEVGEVVAIGISGAAVVIELWRMRRETERHTAHSHRLDDAEARIGRGEEARLLTDLQAALRELRREATAFMEGPGSDRLEASNVRARMTEARQLAEQSETRVLEAALAFVDSCSHVLLWAGKEIPDESRREIDTGIQDTFEVASGAVIGRQGALRRGDLDA